ncbi:zinc-binding dehydrogenase [Sinorhizobium fredii]|uniref:zinc-binding dehydrogenase n=1 Tax=Rhizobium fredii TaxID=380 RepID=UPI000595668F|nr:zinc-binding dehydrogenase [Sinorhizobium fredii]WOS65610.1 zinc-binding dehydrogenase [Sinorhizobium fredii GR64]
MKPENVIDFNGEFRVVPELCDAGAQGPPVTRPSIAHYTANRTEYEAAAKNLFASMEAGMVRASRIATYPLRDACRAHEDLEARRTTGSVVLLP